MFTPAAQRKGGRKRPKGRKVAKRVIVRNSGSNHAVAQQAKIISRLLALEKSHGKLSSPGYRAVNPLVRGAVMSMVNFLNPSGRKPIPRLVPTKVSTFETMVMTQLPYGQMADTGDPRRGLAGITTFKCATRPGAYLNFNQPSGDVDVMMKLKRTAPAVTGLWPTEDGAVDESDTAGTLHLDNTGYVNFVGLISYSDENDSPGRCMQGAQTADGSWFYGIPVDFGTLTEASVQITATTTGANFPVGFQFTIEFVSRTGTVTATHTAVASAVPNITVTCTTSGGTAIGALGGRYGCCMPEAPLGFRIKASTSVDLSALQMKYVHTSSGSATITRWKYVQSPVQSQIQNIYQQMSVVGGGFFATYMGSGLLNGGQSSMYYNRGGSAASLEGLCGIETIGQSLEGFNARMDAGHYCPSYPSTMADLDFYPVRNQIASLSLTQQVAYWAVADITQNHILRVYFVTHNEGTSTSPLVTLKMSPPSPGAESEIIALAARFPLRMDNPKHWGAIADFAKSIWNGVGHGIQRAQSFYEQHKDWIHPLMGAASMAAAALL